MAEDKKGEEAAGRGTPLEAIIKAYRRKTLMEHLVGPIGSIILHVILVILLLKFTIGMAKEEEASIEVTTMEINEAKLDEIQKELEKLQEEPPEMQDMAMEEMVAPTETSNDSIGPEDQEAPDLNALTAITDAQSSLVMKGLWSDRTAGGRKGALGRHAGRYSKAVDDAINRALEWLRRNQKPDGSWGPNNPVAMTGLGLLTFLAHGETTGSEKYGQTVEKAIKYLVAAAEKHGDGRFVDFTPGDCKEGGDPNSYTQGIAAYAIAEAYGLTRIPDLKPIMEKAVDVIIKGQQGGGLWDYRFCKKARWDTSVTGWQVQALKAAYIAGAENPELKAALEKSVAGLQGAQNGDTGKFKYSPEGGDRPAITGIGTLCLQLLGKGKDKSVSKGIEAMGDYDCDWNNAPPWGLYTWYYVTQAKFHEGGTTFSSWNLKFAKTLTANQDPDGHWEAPTPAGNGEPEKYGPVYNTTLCALTLQVYYRMLPTYQKIAVEEEKTETEGEVKVEVM